MQLFIFVAMAPVSLLWATEKHHYESNPKFYLQQYLNGCKYEELKKYLTKKDIKHYIQKDKSLFPWALEQTDNPLMIKALVDSGINLDYFDDEEDETIFHSIAKWPRLIDYDLLLALIARHITGNDCDACVKLFHLLEKKSENSGKTAYKQARKEEKKNFKKYGRPYLYCDPLVEIILKKQDSDYLRYSIQPIIEAHNSMESYQKFNGYKNIPEEKNYIYDYNKPKIPIRPTLALKLFEGGSWKSRFVRNKKNIKILKKIRNYRECHNYDQFTIPKTLALPPTWPTYSPPPPPEIKENILLEDTNFETVCLEASSSEVIVGTPQVKNIIIDPRTPPEILHFKTEAVDDKESITHYIKVWSTSLKNIFPTCIKKGDDSNADK